MKKLTTIWLIFLYFLSISLIENEARLPNELRCGDKDCSTPISKAKTLLHYSPSIEGRVSFRKGIEVEVFSKKDDIWGVKVGDKIGFAPKTFLKESKVFISTENLVTVTQNESPKPVQVDSTQNESADVAVEKTTEIPSVIGSLLSFPSMASAESVEGQNIPTPSSPQYDVVDGTTIWLDPPMPPMQSANEQASPSAPDTKEPESTSSEQIQDGVKISEASDSSENNLVVPTSVNAEQVELPSTPTPLENIITSVDGIDQQGTEKQEVTTNLPEELTGTTTESVMNERTTNSPSLSVETTIEPAADETTESQDIQPTQAGMISNLWNTMFNSGDGTEENSQENDGEEEDEDGEDIDEGDEDGEDGSAEEETVATTTPLPGGEGDSTSNVVVENTEQTSASPGDLSDSFSQGEGASSRNENVRIARQIKTEASEVVHENVVEHEIEKNTQGSVISLDLGTLESSEEKLIEPTSSNLDNVSQIVDENQNQATNLVPDESEEQVKLTEAEEQGEAQDVEKNLQPEEEGKQTENQGVQEQKTLEEEQEQKRLEEEQEQKKLLEEQEQKKLQEEQEQKRLQEEQEQKRLQEEQEEKRLQEEQEQKRLQEEQEQKRLQEEQEQKRLQEEQEQKRLQEEQEQKQLQEEQEQKRLQEEQDQKRLQEEEQKRKVEEENLRLLEAEKKMILENEANLREEQRKREREDAERLQEGQKLRESLEKQREQFKLSQGPQQTAPEVNDIVPEQNVDSVNVSEQDIVNSEEDASTSDPVTTSEGMFSWFSGLFGSSAESGSNDSDQESIAPQPSEAAQPPPPPHLSGSHHHKSPVEHQHEHPPVWSSAHQTMCSTSEAGCDMKSESESENDASSLFMGIQTPSLDVILMRLVATAITLLLGAVSFYFLRKKHVDSSLVARINELEKQLLVASKEAVILREEVSTVDASVNSEELRSLREELESCRLVRADLEEQVSTLERELEEATETGIELNKLLSETLEASKGKAHAGLADSVERLQRQLDGQKERVDSLTRSLKSTSAENESLKSLLAENKEKISVLEAELAAAAEIANNTRREKEEANVLAAQELQQVQSRLEDALSTKVLEESRLHSELSALKLKHETLRSTLSMRDAEVKALQDTLKELEANGGKADKLLDVTKMKAELEEAKKDKASFQEKYIEEEKARKDLEERLVKISETLKKLEVNVDIAEKSKEEAETRLSVLSNYFKEKEEQLQKELGLKEAIVAQHRGDESTVVKHLQSLQEEVSTYRAQNESLKKEILDQERDFKAQMATLEKKAHDNWMTARQAERRLEDSRHEAAQLRNRLTLVEKSNADPSTRMDVNGEGGVASPVMMMPLPPLGDMETPPPLPPFMFSPPPYPPPFMPPPLPPHPMGRPPPLGRMSSPPPPLGQFSPPPPPYDRLDRSSRSPSPPPHRYHHRSPPPPQQWDSPQSSFRPVPKPSPKKPSEHRDHKGSAHNSGHSNESDKSREHV